MVSVEIPPDFLMSSTPTLGNLSAKLVIAGWFLASILLAGFVGSGDFSNLRLWVFLILATTHVLLFLDRTWVLGFAICAVDLWLVGFGFRISSTETAAVVATVFGVLICWRKSVLLPPLVCQGNAFRALRVLLVLYLCYLGGHLVFNHLKPFRPGDYELRNFARTVVAAGGPFLILWVLTRFPRGLPGRDSFPKIMAWILAAALVFNVGAELHHMVSGAMLSLGDAAVPTTFVVPFIDAAPNLYALRRISITAVLVGAGFSGTRWFLGQPGGIRFLFRSLIFLGLGGAVISGGRAVPLLAVGMLLLLHALRGRFLLAASVAVALALATATANTFPGAINRLPAPIQRSLALLVFTDRVEAHSSIESSSEWRWEVFTRSLSEWQSDRRIFWFGRGSYPWSAADERLIQEDGYSNAIDVTIRRGATHNLLSDLLLVHGLVGTTLYLLVILSLERFLAQCRRELAGDELAHTLATLCWIQVVSATLLGLIGGNYLPAEVSWMIGLLVGRLYYRENYGPQKPRVPPPPPAPRQPSPDPIRAFSRAAFPWHPPQQIGLPPRTPRTP
jgi:hypothetical protein